MNRRTHQTADCTANSHASNLKAMAKRGGSPRVSLTFRFSPEAAQRVRSFLADHAGRPMYLKPGVFVEAVLLREIERLELEMLLKDGSTLGPPVQRPMPGVNAHLPHSPTSKTSDCT